MDTPTTKSTSEQKTNDAYIDAPADDKGTFWLKDGTAVETELRDCFCKGENWCHHEDGRSMQFRIDGGQWRQCGSGQYLLKCIAQSDTLEDFRNAWRRLN